MRVCRAKAKKSNALATSTASMTTMVYALQWPLVVSAWTATINITYRGEYDGISVAAREARRDVNMVSERSTWGVKEVQPEGAFGRKRLKEI